MNVKLLRKVQKHIAAEPKRFIMGRFLMRGLPENLIIPGANGANAENPFENSQRFAQCGTAACIAGWAALLGSRKAVAQELDHWNVELTAQKRLKLGDKRSSRLFWANHWPLKFRRRYKNAATPEKRAEIAIARIEHFIKTNGAK